MAHDEQTPPGGGRLAVAQLSEVLPDGPAPPLDPEEFAEAAGVDPTAQEVQEYERRLKEAAPEPVSEPAD